MRGASTLRSADFIVLFCISAMMLSAILPAIAGTSGRSRSAVCRNNLKAIGVGLDVWKQHTGRYPWWSHPDGADMRPWPDVLAMQNGYSPEKLEALRSWFESHGVDIDDMVKTIDDTSVFMCPADHPHPHRINEGRARAWGFWRSSDDDGYEYSYTITACASQARSHPASDRQMLSADGLWDWCENLSAQWVVDPGASFDDPAWYCNTVGYCP